MKKLHASILVLLLAVFAVGCAQKAAPQSALTAPATTLEHQAVPVWFADGTQGQLIVPVNRARVFAGDTLGTGRTGFMPVGFEAPMAAPQVYDRAGVDYPVVQRPAQTTPRYRAASRTQPAYRSYSDNGEYRAEPRKRSLKKSAIIVGGSAAGGAVIGAVAGGKKGAVIGGLSGAGAGFVYDMLTRNKKR